MNLVSVYPMNRTLPAIIIVTFVGAISFMIWTIVIVIKAREEILLEQELLPTTQEGISRNYVELEMLRTVPETNTGTRPKDSNYRGYQMVQDPPPPYTPTLKCLIKEQGLISAYKYLKGETINQ